MKTSGRAPWQARVGEDYWEFPKLLKARGDPCIPVIVNRARNLESFLNI